MAKLQVEYRNTADLVPYARNARIHTSAQIEQVANSIQEFGWTNPVLVDGANGIIAGHCRVSAAERLGLEQVPCIELSDLSDKQRQAYVLADNQLALNAAWNFDILAFEFSALEEVDFDLSLLGFTDADIAQAYGANSDVIDVNAEWSGMPEFISEDKTAFRSIVVHFPNQEAVDSFAGAVNQQITDKTRFLWYPRIEIERYADKRYAASS